MLTKNIQIQCLVNELETESFASKQKKNKDDGYLLVRII